MNTKNWLSTIDGNLNLKDICIPGSHDAGMYKTDVLSDKIPVVSSLALTQGFDMKGQMENGVRYFDLRPEYLDAIGPYKLDEPVFATYHGPKLMRLYGDLVARILYSADRFIEENKSEFLILNFSHWEGFNANVDGKFIDLLLSCISANHLLQIAAGSKITDLRLADVRGKIILVIENTAMYNNEVVAKNRKGIFNMDKEFSLLDRYSDKKHYEQMLVHQMDEFGKFNDSDKLFLLNWTLTPDGWNVLPTQSSVLDYSEDINPKLLGYGHSRDFLFHPNFYGKIVNIINGDFWDVIKSKIVDACIEVMNNRGKSQERVHLTSIGSNESLDMANAEKVYGLASNKSPYQVWYKKHVRDNIYRLQNAATGLYLIASTENIMTGALSWLGLKEKRNHLYGSLEDAAEDNTLWHFESAGGDKFHIVSYRRKKDKEAEDRLDGSGGNIYLHKPNDGDFQKWKEEKVEAGK